MAGAAGRWIVGAVFVIIVLAIAASIFFLIPKAVVPGGGDDPTSSASPTPTPTPPPNDGGVPDDQNEGAQPQPGDLTDVVPFITNAVLAPDSLSVTVYSFVPGLAENGGTCTASVVGGAATEFAQGPAAIEVADTVCPPLTITLAAPAAPGLQVRVEYSSETASGVSADTEVTS